MTVSGFVNSGFSNMESVSVFVLDANMLDLSAFRQPNFGDASVAVICCVAVSISIASKRLNQREFCMSLRDDKCAQMRDRVSG